MSIFHLVQTELLWEDPAANRVKLASQMAGLNQGAVVLPEMFTTGFSMNSAKLAETMDGETVSWLKSSAPERQGPICGSLIIRDTDQCFNRLIWCSESGEHVSYDKRHLFRMSDEHNFYTPGRQRVIIKHGNLRVLPQICYDLRFPVWSRNLGDYDVMLFVANWPAARHQQWLTLLRARAIENLCYVVAVNRVGSDGNGIDYTGGSCVIGPDGEYLVSPMNGEQNASVELSVKALNDYRTVFPAFMDSDTFELSPSEHRNKHAG